MKELIPFFLQGVFIGVDEFYCHQRRLLRRFERIGHPIDSLLFSSCFIFLYFAQATAQNLWLYSALAILSCMLVTKDEWQHVHLCNGFENWLHACLFILHPVVLIWTGFLWWSHHSSAQAVIVLSMTATFLFFIYQVIYWNWINDQQ